MKTTANIVGYFAAFLTIMTTIFKITHLAGAGPLMLITGICLSIYFPVYIINKLADTNRGQSMTMHYVLGISVGLLQLSLAFKIGHLPGAGLLLIVGFATLSLIYFPMLLRYKLKHVPEQNFKIIYISGFIGAVAMSLGFVFKIQRWPFGVELMFLGAGILFFIYFPLYLFNFSKNLEDTYIYLRDVFFALIIGGMLAIFIMGDIIHRKPTCVITTDKMEVLYVGIDNPLSVNVSGVPYEELNFSVDNGIITVADGKYIAKVVSPGTATIDVYRGGEKIGSKDFRVELPPGSH